MSVISILSINGCNSAANMLSPEELKDGVAKNSAIASEVSRRYGNGDMTPEQVQTYLVQNASAWFELDVYHNRSTR